MPTFPVSRGERDVRIELNDGVYPLSAIHGTAVVFIDKAYIRVERVEQGRTRVTLRPKLASTPDELQGMAGDWLNELLHQALRVEVNSKTRKLRELVIGKAIMAAEQQPESLDAGVAFSDDPLGIAQPWEEKYLGDASPAAAGSPDQTGEAK